MADESNLHLVLYFTCTEKELRQISRGLVYRLGESLSNTLRNYWAIGPRDHSGVSSVDESETGMLNSCELDPTALITSF